MALVVGIVVGAVRRSGRRELEGSVVWGIVAGLGASVVAAVLFQELAGGFQGKAEQVFEGATMLAGAALVTVTVLWASGSTRGREIERQATARLAAGAAAGVFFLVFISILREGAELVVFLAASRLVGRGIGLLGAILGLAAAAVLGLALNVLARSGLRALFAVTSVLLVLFAAGLVSRGLHELSEAGLLPPLVGQLWDINPPPRADGSLPALHEEGSVGGVLRSLFGYTGAPSALDAIGWAGYLVTAGLFITIRRTTAAKRARKVGGRQ